MALILIFRLLSTWIKRVELGTSAAAAGHGAESRMDFLDLFL